MNEGEPTTSEISGEQLINLLVQVCFSNDVDLVEMNLIGIGRIILNG
jgi:hypothetical protein